MEKDKSSGYRKLLVISLFKNSGLWINDVISCIDNLINYNDSLSDDNKLLIKLAFLKSTFNSDNTNDILNNYIKLSKLDIWHHEFDVESNTMTRYEKLAFLRNYLIENSTKNTKLNYNDLILFMDSDVKFDENVIHELIIDMNKSGADVIAPLVCIENYGAFKNNYFYDTLAFINKDNENFSHFKPYIFGDINKSKIKEQNKETEKLLEKIRDLNKLRIINWEFNKNAPLDNTFPENLYRKVHSLIDLNIPLQVNSVGAFYIMKYGVVKAIKYTGEKTSEQVEFMNTARSRHYKIFISQRLKVLHVNLEKYGLKWH